MSIYDKVTLREYLISIHKLPKEFRESLDKTNVLKKNIKPLSPGLLLRIY